MRYAVMLTVTEWSGYSARVRDVTDTLHDTLLEAQARMGFFATCGDRSVGRVWIEPRTS